MTGVLTAAVLVLFLICLTRWAARILRRLIEDMMKDDGEEQGKD